MVERILITVSAAIIGWLGFMHLKLTFVGDKLTPSDIGVRESMQRVAPNISAETTMWKAWVGFNASHSLGALLFGLVYAYLAIAHPHLLFQSWFLLGLGAALLGSYLWLGASYWFSTPLVAIAVASVSYLGGAIWGAIARFG